MKCQSPMWEIGNEIPSSLIINNINSNYVWHKKKFLSMCIYRVYRGAHTLSAFRI